MSTSTKLRYPCAAGCGRTVPASWRFCRDRACASVRWQNKTWADYKTVLTPSRPFGGCVVWSCRFPALGLPGMPDRLCTHHAVVECIICQTLFHTRRPNFQVCHVCLAVEAAWRAGRSEREAERREERAASAKIRAHEEQQRAAKRSEETLLRRAQREAERETARQARRVQREAREAARVAQREARRTEREAERSLRRNARKRKRSVSQGGAVRASIWRPLPADYIEYGSRYEWDDQTSEAVLQAESVTLSELRRMVKALPIIPAEWEQKVRDGQLRLVMDGDEVAFMCIRSHHWDGLPWRDDGLLPTPTQSGGR